MASEREARAQQADLDSALLVYVNGALVPEAEATISVFDSGLNFADGVFEGIRVYNGRVFRLGQHIRRLYESAAAFSLRIPFTESELATEITGWLSANRVTDDFHFRPIVTRGRRFPPRLDPSFCNDDPTILFVGGPISSASLDGITVAVSSYRRVAADAIDPRIKSLNYGNNLLGRLEAGRRGVNDVIMLDSMGYVAEASAANVFIVREGILATPWPKACLDGITRRALIDLARDKGIPVVERDITVTELVNADELFLCGTGTEVSPIVEVEGVAIGDRKAGPITLALSSSYRELTRSEGVPL